MGPGLTWSRGRPTITLACFVTISQPVETHAMMTRLLVLLCLATSAPAADMTHPEMRHVHYIAVSAPKGAELACDLECTAHGYRAYQDSLKARLVGPDGIVVSAKRVEPGKSVALRQQVAWDGLCALEMNSGWNLSSLRVHDDVPYAFVSRLGVPFRTVRAWGPLHFYVPEGARYFNVWITASVTREGLHYTIWDPDRQVVRDDDGDFDKRTKVQIMVPERHRGAAWSMAISKPTTKGMNLDDVYVELGRHLPPFLSPKPEWAKLFAGDWRYDPKTPRPKRRFDGIPAEVEPFHGVRSAEIDAAYDRDVSKGWKTTLPVTYVLDYGTRHVANPKYILTIDDPKRGPQLQGDPNYITTVGTAPPALLHLGKDVALNHGWGPVKSLGGENQAHGRGDYITRLTPDQVRDRIVALREMAQGLRKAGVRWVTPYICAMTIDGNHEKRTGLWDFYDHWEDYSGLGLGPRPAGDPFTWLQRNPDGTPRIYYRYTGDHYPRFEPPNHRYAASWHVQGFRQWMREVVRFLAKCDFDGCFPDNGTSQRCIGPAALVEFKKYLRQKFTPAQTRQMLAVEDIASVEFPKKAETPLYAEMQRFWCETIRDEMAFIKRVGTQELGREFVVFPNGGRPAFIQCALMDTDFVMFEKSHGEYGTHPGLVFSPVFEGVKLRAYNDNIFEHKFVQSLRRRVKPMILSRPGYPQRLPWAMLNANAARLGCAECAAFSGGGGFLLRPRFDLYHDALNEYRRFFETHPRLYAGLDTYASVGVLAWPEQAWYGNSSHLGSVRRLTDLLGEAHVLFDYIPESQTTPDVLNRYQTVVAPEAHCVSAAQMAALKAFVQAGGRLIVLGQFAKYDEAMKERGSPGLSPQAVCEEPEEVVAAIGTSASAAPNADSLHERHVKLNAFAAQGRIVIHVVNYNVPLGIEPEDVVEIEGFELDVPLGPNTRCTKATCYSPIESRATELLVRNVAGRARLTLPTLRIYRVVELTVTE